MIRAFSQTLLPSSYAYTVEPFFYFNLRWCIREVDVREVVQQQYNEYRFYVADAYRARLLLHCVPMTADRITTFLCALVDSDDYVDLYLLNGAYIRNLQKELA